MYPEHIVFVFYFTQAALEKALNIFYEYSPHTMLH